MQKVSVQSEAVKRNVVVFQQTIRKSGKKGQKQSVYPAYIHCKTGAISFSEVSGSDWKRVEIHLDIEGKKIGVFEVGKGPLDEKALIASAYQVLSQTLEVLQKIILLIHTIAEIGEIEVDPPLIQAGKDIVHEAWHQLDRMGAEKILLMTSPGTYLFRKDEYAVILEQELMEALSLEVKCFTLSYLDEEGIVRDKTVILSQGKWSFYDDDPSLHEKTYPSIEKLLESVGSILSLPLLHT